MGVLLSRAATTLNAAFGFPPIVNDVTASSECESDVLAVRKRQYGDGATTNLSAKVAQ
jgi:hypothetical protein